MIRAWDLPGLLIVIALFGLDFWLLNLLLGKETIAKLAGHLVGQILLFIVLIAIPIVAGFFLWRIVLAKLTGEHPDFRPL